MNRQPKLVIRPCELRDANAFVAGLHRHHKPVVGHRWSCSAVTSDGTVVGVATIGRPVSRGTNPRAIVEVTRVCTDGTPNACSALYGAACRQQRAMGYAKAQTYILESEPGTSLRAAGWRPVARTAGGSWSTPSRARQDKAPTDPKIRWECPCSDLPVIDAINNPRELAA